MKRAVALLLMAGFGTVAAVELELPIAMNDVGTQVYGVAPFGYHVAEHRYDGHPGLDFEYVPGSKIRAAHGGSFRYTTDSRDPNLKTVTIEWQENGLNFQTFYTNVSILEPGIDNGVTVATGQAFGTAGTITATVNNQTRTYAMTHFQFADNRVNYGLTNFSALSPEPFFSATARADLAAIWQKMQYHQMICEPYLTTSRGMIPYPVVTRRWARESGSLANVIEFTCDFSSSSASAYSYRFLDAAGLATETGIVVVSAVVGGTSSIDFTPSGGGTRRGVFTAKDSSLRIDYAAIGAARPVDLGAASAYITTAASICAAISDAVCFTGNVSPYRAGDRLNLGVAVDWNRVTAGTTSGDLWVGMRLPAGEFLYAHPDGQWRAEATALVTGMRASGEISLFDALLPAGLPVGNYLVYAAINPAGAPLMIDALLSNIATAHLYATP